MSFAMTTKQVRNQTKTVTRRFGWWFLKAGDIVQPVEKAMGLKKGEKIQKIGCPIRIISTRKEPLNAITKEDVAREGFGSASAFWFVAMIRHHYRCAADKEINRIEFEYLAGQQGERPSTRSGDAMTTPTTPARVEGTLDPLLAGNCVFRLKDVRQCKRPATELTTWGAFCWQHASPRFAIRSLTQEQANDESETLT